MALVFTVIIFILSLLYRLTIIYDNDQCSYITYLCNLPKIIYFSDLQ